MRVLLAVVALAFGAWLQASPLNALLPVRLDPLLIMVVAWGVGTGMRGGMAFGLAAGAVQDLLTGGGLLMTLPKLLVGLLAGSLKPLLFYRQAIIIMPLVAVCTFMQEGMVAGGFALLGKGLMFEHLGSIAPAEALGNFVIAWPLYQLVRWGLKRTQDRFGLRPETLP
ncbi:MAG TPA: rod shape-determining protein MreD [Stenomitos sp.]